MLIRERYQRRSSFSQCHAYNCQCFINDDESGLHHDYKEWLEAMAPHEPVSSYRHNDTGEDNADAHIKRQIMGREVVVAVTSGKLDFGPWEQIFMGNLMGVGRKGYLLKLSECNIYYSYNLH